MNLTIKNLSKTYPNGVQALKNISLTISNGMFGLLGPNGAGKSTLMRIIATIQDPDSGEISLDGINVLTQKTTVRQILGYLPQEFGLDPKVITEDLLEHFAILKGISNSKERKQSVKTLLHQANLYESRKKRLGSLSGGMKQRFGIAQALIGNPKLLIVDEPTAGLDPEERLRFHNILSEIGEQVVVILSTHIVDDVSDLCSQMAIISEGQLLLVSSPQDALGQLKGKIWTKPIEKAALSEYKDKFNILSTRLFGGKTKLRIHNSNAPESDFEQSEPILEDVYFHTIKTHSPHLLHNSTIQEPEVTRV
jgi:ABC-2 type transport system ATP-binding protein